MRTEIAQANAVARVFGSSNLQVNWQTITLELEATTAGAQTYPILYPGTSANSYYQFQVDAILLGVGMSGVWITAALAEQACVALAPKGPTQISLLKSIGFYFHTCIFCKAAVTGGLIIQRNPGFMFPPPLVKYVQAGTTIQMFGSKQTAPGIYWRYTASLYFVSVPDYLRMMDNSTL